LGMGWLLSFSSDWRFGVVGSLKWLL